MFMDDAHVGTCLVICVVVRDLCKGWSVGVVLGVQPRDNTFAGMRLDVAR